MKNPLKNIARNCRQATWLIEKKLAGRLTMREQLALKVHLAACSGCSLFAQQSLWINQLVAGGRRLDDDFKRKMQAQIMEKMKKI